MNNKLTLAIPKPCSQTWEQMKPTELGGFCQHCSTEVIDFTKMSTEELQRYFSHITGEVCGRLDSSQLEQLNRLNAINTSTPNRFSYKLLLASAIALFVHSDASSQQPSSKKHEPTHLEETGLSEKKSKGYRGTFEIRGVVKAAEDQSPIDKASVMVVSTGQGIITDSLGKFKLIVKGEPKQKQRLKVSYLGYETTNVDIVLGENSELIITLQPDQLIMGEVVVVGPKSRICTTLVGSIRYTTTKRPSFFKRVINHVGNWFR
jgi:hypothetical protein